MTATATAPLDLAQLQPGFTDPARDSQASFRAIMTATSQPGKIAQFGHAPIPPAGLNKAAGVALLTLADQDTKLWLDPALRVASIESWLRFHTGAPLTLSQADAGFALVADLEALLDMGLFHQGDAKFPDLATTVIIMVDSLSAGPSLTLRGPGIATHAQFAPTGLPREFWDQRGELVSHFQFGIDLMICADDQLVCIPRTTRITFEH
jgi:alpha-D-ribose 1-methylphosphonate 5-triphosphate synthase subunit PhnH